MQSGEVARDLGQPRVVAAGVVGRESQQLREARGNLAAGRRRRVRRPVLVLAERFNPVAWKPGHLVGGGNAGRLNALVDVASIGGAIAWYIVRLKRKIDAGRR
ncbi:hypothetical protein [Streptomyces sp. AB3(2024)]|uniref:hypothetical protein n=1 Tax=Streptomyces sp. AB3(2024) TaxID=3317321 RepID=UPI0035A2C7BE